MEPLMKCILYVSAQWMELPPVHVSVNLTTQAYSAVIGPSVVLAKPVFPWWQSSTRWVHLKISSEPMNLVQGSTHLNLSAPHPHYCSLCIAHLYTKTPLEYQIQNNSVFSATQSSDQSCTSVDKADKFAHSLLCSGQERSFEMLPLLDTCPRLLVTYHPLLSL